MTPIPESLLKEIVEAASKATPGKRFREPQYEDGFLVTPMICATAASKGNRVFAKTNGGTFPSADADLIALLDPPTALALVSAARRGEKMEELVSRWNDWFEANQNDMECRMDEDCDHCVGARILREARYAARAALKPEGE